jgi:hypothetical protein
MGKEHNWIPQKALLYWSDNWRAKEEENQSL